MIQFSTLQQAENYRNICPACQSNLGIRDASFLLSENSSIYGEYPMMHIKNNNLVMVLTPSDQFYWTKMEVDWNSGKIMSINLDDSFNLNYINYMLSFVCSCDQYSYRVQLDIDLLDGYISDMQLVSEYLEISLSERLTNYYILNSTEYQKEYMGKIVVLPLIEFDYSDINKNFQRIKTLMTFL